MAELMKIEDVIKRYDRGEKLKFEIFNEGDFAQFERCIFEVKNISYFCVEQYLLANQAILFRDDVMLEKIMTAKSIRQARLFGDKIRNFDQEEWNHHKLNMAYVGNLCKFRQNENLKFKLLETENKIIVNADPYEKDWGIKKRITELDIKNPHSWKGENQLGFILMMIREELK